MSEQESMRGSDGRPQITMAECVKGHQSTRQEREFSKINIYIVYIFFI